MYLRGVFDDDDRGSAENKNSADHVEHGGTDATGREYEMFSRFTKKVSFPHLYVISSILSFNSM